MNPLIGHNRSAFSRIPRVSGDEPVLTGYCCLFFFIPRVSGDEPLT